MIRCGLVEGDDAAMARFRGGLNREIQDILEYKEYTDMTTLFAYACKADREVHGHRSTRYTNPFAARSSSSSSAAAALVPAATTTSTRAQAPTPASVTLALGADPATGRTQDIQCHRCKGFGHMFWDCPNKRTLIIRDTGEYSSESDSKDTIHAMLASDHAAKEEVHVNPGDTDRYESLVAQHVLSSQVAPPEKNQRHTLFHTKGVVQERSIQIIIDSGSCNNLASTMLVEKLSLPTRKHLNPYHIQWLNDGGKLELLSRCVFLFPWVHILILLIVMLFLWKHARCYSVDLGNMILIACIMVVQIFILLCLRVRK